MSNPPRPGAHRRARAFLTTAVLAIIGLLAPVTLASAGPTPSQSTAKPTIVLVHGAWADASSWAPVTRRLQADGYTVLAPPNPLRGLASDAASLAAFVQQRTTGPVVLVGHSYGGAVITNAARSDPDVKSLVYVNAFAPDLGETILGLQGGGDPNALFDAVQYPGAPPGDVDLYLKVAVFPQVFAGDLPAATAAQLATAQRPVTLSALLEPSAAPAWKHLPSWYLLGTADRAIAPSLQLFMAQRAHSRITSVHASHASPLSRPGAVARVIVAAARATT
ncbi:MAG TPA: alpha/beta hydrolase [Pilimelia sp.]|nr:alpha/beta hydrolase [Pilimelia sp.]